MLSTEDVYFKTHQDGRIREVLAREYPKSPVMADSTIQCFVNEFLDMSNVLDV